MRKKGKNRKGQVYLIAAIIIVTIAAGFITIANYASSSQTRDIYYLRDEIKIEGSRTADYAILNGKNFAATMANFSEQYINNTEDYNFYFILGDLDSMTFLAYQSFSASVSKDGIDKTEDIGTGRIFSEEFTPAENVTLGINGNDYVFKLNVGNNYRFILYDEKGGQKQTVIG